MSAPDTFYHATATDFPRQPPLSGDRTVEVCIIGGGLTGVGAALELAGRGRDVLLLEAEEIGHGASGRNGGQIVVGYSCDISRIVSAVGPDAAQDAWKLALEAIDIVRSRATDLKIDCGLRWGYVFAALNQKQMSELQEMQDEWSDTYGYDGLTYLSRDNIRSYVSTDTYAGGLYDAGSGQLHPLKYLHGLANEAIRLGATICEESRVAELKASGGKQQVVTNKGIVTADHVILAGNAYLGPVSKRLQRRLAPVASFVGATQPLCDDLAADILPQDVAVADCSAALDYYRLTDDKRLLFGGGADYAAMDPASLHDYLGRKMRRTFPQLQDVGFDYVWSGLIGVTVNRIPDIGSFSDCLHYAQGFSGHGVAMTGLAGRLIAERICGESDRIALFEKVNHLPFPGGPFRTPALVLGMAWHKMRDRLGI